MSLYATLNDLKADITREVERVNNAKFALALPRIIASAEHRMFHGCDAPLKSDPIRLRIMESEATLSLVDGECSLPTDYLSTMRLMWSGSPVTHPTYETPNSFFLNRYVNTGGSPVRYTIEGDKLYVSPKVTGSISFSYYARPDELVEDTDTNDVLTTYPMLYFHAALIEAYSYLRNPNEMQKQFGTYVSMAGGLSRSQTEARQGSSSPMAPRIPGWRI